MSVCSLATAYVLSRGIATLLGCSAVRVGGTRRAAPERLPRRGGGGRRRPGVGVAASAPPGVACNAAMGCGGCEWRWFRRRLIDLQMRRRVLSGLRGRRPGPGEADQKLLHAWAWGTEPQPISPGQPSVCLQSIYWQSHIAPQNAEQTQRTSEGHRDNVSLHLCKQRLAKAAQ